MQRVWSPNSGGLGLDRSLCSLNVDDTKHGEFHFLLASLSDTSAFSLEGGVCF
ncbi:MAG: hypothetical protein AAB308_17050 [Nitrospirota bacterium]